MFVWTDIVTWLLVGVYFYLVLSAIMVVILENRKPIRSLTWLLVLTFLPGLGLLFYLIFGQKLRQRKRIKKLSIRAGKSAPKVKPDLSVLTRNSPLTDNAKGLIRLLYHCDEALVYEDSKIDVLAEPEDIFEHIFEDLEKAKDHIHIEFYIIENDLIGNRLLDLLLKKSAEGVRIRLIYDYWGCFSLPKKYIRTLRKSKIRFHAFFPPKFPFILSRLNYRNHRKLIVIDGKIGYTGGCNMANRYLYGDSLGLWRDTMVRLEGSAVLGLQEVFSDDWYFVDRKILDKDKLFPRQKTFTKNLVQIVDSGPDTMFSSILLGMHYAISTAQKYVYMQTPYFIPPEEIATAIEIAALRGVDIRLLIPSRADALMASDSNFSYIERMLNAGVRVYQYQKGFLHSKAWVVDDSISSVGTANIDFRSYEQNFELSSFIYEEETALKLKSLFLKDLEVSREINKEEWEKRPKYQKFKESLARLFSPIL